MFPKHRDKIKNDCDANCHKRLSLARKHVDFDLMTSRLPIKSEDILLEVIPFLKVEEKVSLSLIEENLIQQNEEFDFIGTLLFTYSRNIL